MSVKELAKEIFASESTVRRDLTQLEAEGVLKRTRGGASYVNPDKVKYSFMVRNKSNIEKKHHIAKLATKFVESGDSIFIDSSTTCLSFAEELPENIELDILTFGIHTAHQLAVNTNSFVECVCGKYYPTRSSIYGNDACNFISQHHAKTCFMSGCGLHVEYGLTEYSREETSLG